MKRVMSIMLSVILLVSSVGVVDASGDALTTETENSVVTVAENFLDKYLESLYLYVDDGFSTYSVSDLKTEKSTSVIDYHGEKVSIQSLMDNIVFLKDKVRYWSYVRRAQSIYRTDFQVEYILHDVAVEGNYATVDISAMMTFRYIDCEENSLREDIFTVELVNIGGNWLVSDVLESMDWFDSQYRNNSDFDVDKLIEEYCEVDAADRIVADIPASEPSRSLASYNVNNATAYAFTYATSVAGNTATDFYNENFQYFSADCMNFASQCIWAGLGGNNVASATIAHSFPMDTRGSYNWFSSQQTDDHTAAWSSCSGFRKYIDNLKSNTSEAGMRVAKYDIPNNTSFAGCNEDTLLGSVMFVHGSSGDYGHAIMITDVEGTGRNQVFYTAHSPMAKHLRVGDEWNTCPIKIYRPIAMYTDVIIASPKITVEMYRPVPRGTTLALSAETDVTCYRIRTSITKPSGGVSNHNSNNTSNSTWNYTFSEVGLYTIKVSAMKTSTSSEVDYYYTIRIY